MPISRWDDRDVAVECNDCGFELGRYGNCVDATSAALHARWKIETPTYDPAVHLDRTIYGKPFYRETPDGDIEYTDLEEYARRLRLWGRCESVIDTTGMSHFAWLDHLEGKLEEYLEKLMMDPVWQGDCYCHACAARND